MSIASRRWRPEGGSLSVQHFPDYEQGIEESGADLAYISLENSNHALWAERALEKGMHVVVDKPAFLTVQDARRLVELAEAKRRCLAEATVFAHHPQIAALRGLFGSGGAARVNAIFSFPPLDPGDFRYRRDRGGGALLDVGPYAVATSRVFFGRAPRSVACEVLARRVDGVDTAFSVLLCYDGGAAMTGHFGFDTEYLNRLLAFGPGVAGELNRAFTLPPEATNRVVVRKNNLESEIAVAPADTFALFLGDVVGAIRAGDWNRFVQALLEDAELLARLRKTSGES